MYNFVNWGFNVRPTDLQAAFGIVQLQNWTVLMIKEINYLQSSEIESAAFLI